jgi:hypothetical protein
MRKAFGRAAGLVALAVALGTLGALLTLLELRGVPATALHASGQGDPGRTCRLWPNAVSRVGEKELVHGQTRVGPLRIGKRLPRAAS